MSCNPGLKLKECEIRSLVSGEGENKVNVSGIYSLIKVEDNSQVTIGDSNTLGAELTVTDNSSLRIEETLSGSRINISNESVYNLNSADGGTINFDEGVFSGAGLDFISGTYYNSEGQACDEVFNGNCTFD